MSVNNSWVNEIPIKVTAVKRRESKFSPRQGITMTLGILLGVIVPVLILDFCTRTDNNFYKIMGTVIMVSFLFVDLRVSLKMFFNETSMYQEYKVMHENPVYTFGDFWDILFIDKSGIVVTADKENGSQTRSVIIKMERTNTIGRPPEFEYRHYVGTTLFIRELLQRDYRIRRYNLSVNDTNEQHFFNIEKNLRQLTNNCLKDSMTKILNYNRLSVKDKQNRSVEYYMVTSAGTRDTLLNDVSEAMSILVGSTIYKPYICVGKELNEFFQSVSKLRVLSVDNLIKDNLPKEHIVKVISVEEKVPEENIFDKSVTKEDIALERYNRMLKSLEED